MPVATITSADSYASAALVYAANHISQSSTWQALCGDTTGRDRVVFFSGGQPELTGEKNPTNIDGNVIDFGAQMCFISQSEFTRERICPGYYRHKGQVEFMFYLKPDAETNPGADVNWMIQQLDKIAADMEANLGKSGYITEAQLRALQLGIGKPISELESMAINMVSQQIYAAEIKPKEDEPCAENTTK